MQYNIGKKSIEGIPWTNPILRWAGSKRKLLPILLSNVPSDYQRYIEPFCGSACLFFALHPQKAILGDINCELIHCYNYIQKHPYLLSKAASEIPNTPVAYYNIRKKSPEILSPLDRAARFIYLNRYCFNGVYRTNKKGEFNVPRGTRTGSFPSAKAFYRCSYALRSANLLSMDFTKCLSRVKFGDFVYLDPPYATPKKLKIEEYGPGSFQHGDIKRLIDALVGIDNIGASFLLSYADSDELLNSLTPKWNVEKVRVRRHVAGFSKHRQVVGEVLVSNYKISM